MGMMEEKIGKVCKDLDALRHETIEHIAPLRFAPGHRSDSNLCWTEYQNGDVWAKKDDHACFQAVASIDPQYEGQVIALSVHAFTKGWDAVNPQFIVYINGRLEQGVDINHTTVMLCDCAKAGQKFDIEIEGYSGMESEQTAFALSLISINQEVTDLYYNLKVPLEIIEHMDEHDKARHDLLHALNRTVRLIDFRLERHPSFYASVKKANEYIREHVYEKMKDRSDTIATCVGHTHIDVAWLWTVAQTREKTVRSFATALKYMEQYPEFVFMSSQPQLYQFLKEDAPDVYERVKQVIAEGRWEAEGGMWLEADCNVPSGESLVRQILFGKMFFKKEFGVDSKMVWLPDVFGYNAAMPQIMKKSGIEYFMTTKINWNRFNKMPYDTFMWRGLDGSEILTHFITTQDAKEKRFFTTYNGILDASSTIGAWRRYGHKERHNDVLISYGYGDGGGGPTESMIEQIRRMNKGLPGCPKTEQGKALDYFTRLEKAFDQGEDAPVWQGELYLEYHQGTYTSMGRNKRANRKCEIMLGTIESLYAMLMPAGIAYPREQINGLWQTVLLNQFHDILPGSSIEPVYDVTDKEYKKVQREGEQLINRALHTLSTMVQTDPDALIAYNALGAKRDAFLEFTTSTEVTALKDETTGVVYPVQKIDADRYLARVFDLPAKGYKTFLPNQTVQIEDDSLKASATCLQNRFYDIVLDEKGRIESIYDKRSEQHVLKEGALGNVLQVFEDRPRYDENWNIENYFEEKQYEIDDVTDIRVEEQGPVRAGVTIKRHYLKSTVLQTIYLYRDSPLIDFHTVIDWKDKQMLLKACFPVNVRAEKATYDIQFGNVERSTHNNTSWDQAKYEMCAHQWVDVSRHDYGVSLINDCKYGHDIKNGNMRITLLKSGIHPNPNADKEIHHIRYALYPHAKTWREANTPGVAKDYNTDVKVMLCKANQAASWPAERSLFETDASDHVILETVKQCETTGTWILRFHEIYNARAKVRIRCAFLLSRVAECDLMENEEAQVEHEDHTFSFDIAPYEIKTFRVAFTDQ